MSGFHQPPVLSPNIKVRDTVINRTDYCLRKNYNQFLLHEPGYIFGKSLRGVLLKSSEKRIPVHIRKCLGECDRRLTTEEAPA